MMEAFGRKGFLVENPKDLKGALEEAINFRGPRPRQRRNLAGRRPQAASVPLAELTPFADEGRFPAGSGLLRFRQPLLL
jgi:hypothetical protein